jgi:hypothetical protein
MPRPLSQALERDGALGGFPLHHSGMLRLCDVALEVEETQGNVRALRSLSTQIARDGSSPRLIIRSSGDEDAAAAVDAEARDAARALSSFSPDHSPSSTLSDSEMDVCVKGPSQPSNSSKRKRSSSVSNGSSSAKRGKKTATAPPYGARRCPSVSAHGRTLPCDQPLAAHSKLTTLAHVSRRNSHHG